MKLGWIGCLLLASACTIPRPEGAYDPEPFFEEDAGSKPGFVRDASVRDARVVPRADTGVSRTRSDAAMSTGPNEAGDNTSPGNTHPLAALEGERFLMRMDLYSKVKAQTSIVALELNNRLSNLLLVDFVLEGDEIVSKEVLCDQNYEHECVSGCDSWQTAVHEHVLDFFIETKRSVTRHYQFDAATGELRGLNTSMPLGFDEDEQKKTLPTGVADSRLWKIEEGFGVYTQFDAVIATLGKPKISCQVSSVQRFLTTFSGKLGKDVSALEGLEFAIDTTGTDGAVLKVTGTPATQCTKQQFDGQASQNEVSKLHFKRFNGEGCPPDFDGVFPPIARFLK